MSEFTFKLPDLGEGTVEAEIAEWMVKVGDLVQEEDPIGSVLTDKAAVELSAPVSGRVLSLAGELGDMVAVGAKLISFETSGEQPAQEETSTPAASEVVEASKPAQLSSAASVSPEPTGNTKVLTSPSVRQYARSVGIDLSQISGTGPRGRIRRSDLDQHVAGQTAVPTANIQSPPAAEVTEIKVVGLRRIIAERMSQANRDIPHFAYVEEIDITALESLRQHLNSKNPLKEEKLTLLPFIGLALTRALKLFPQCNALYDSERNVICQHQAVHLGIATQTPDGLKVPVVKHSESRTLADLSGEIRRVSSAARENTAKRDELMGSTITITSLGKLGGIVTTPVINQPEVAIIGVNKAVDRPIPLSAPVMKTIFPSKLFIKAPLSFGCYEP